MARRLLTVKQAAERINVSPMTVYRLIYAQRIKVNNVGLGTKRPRLRVAEDEVERFIATTEVEGVAA